MKAKQRISNLRSLLTDAEVPRNWEQKSKQVDTGTLAHNSLRAIKLKAASDWV